ncbi:hypothetical protein ACJQWK_02582 [Exserohilum turcicum]
MCNEFIDDPAVQKGIINSCVRNVQVLLLFALGSCQPIADDTEHSRTMPGQVYYSYAKDILRCKLGECNIPVAQALTLAALYTNQNGMLQDSLAHLCIARDIYRDVVRNTSISEETKRSFWIYQDLACGINNCCSLISSNPFPDHWNTLLPEGSEGQFSESVYWTRVSLRILLNALRDFARPHFPTTREIDEKDLCALEELANRQIAMLEVWRKNLTSQLTWNGTEPPSTDPLLASLRAEFSEGMAELLRPYLDIMRYALHSTVHSTENELSEGQQGILRVLLYWEKYALSSFVSFDRVGAASDSTYEIYQSTSDSSVMLSNPISKMHTQFKTVLIFRAIRSSAIYPLIAKRTELTDEVMETLRRRTIKRLSEFQPGHRTLTQDLRALNKLWLLENQVSSVELIGVCNLA